MNSKKKKFYYCLYSLLFFLIAFLIVYFYYSSGKSIIEATGDCFRQHYRAVLYYSDLLKEFFSNLSQGKVIIPQWDFSIGEGSDILNSLHYYCVGDIFTFFSFLCPREYMYIYFDFITILRMYLSGITLSNLCFYKKKNNIYMIAGAALLYAYCPFSMSNLSSHVFFLSAAVYLPMIILGVEKIIEGDKWYQLSIAVMLSAISNIYFFYMNVISTIIYSLIRIIFINKTIKEKIGLLINITASSFLGVMLGGIVFLPVFYTMISNTRLETRVDSGLLYSIGDYLGYIKGFIF